MGILMAEYVFGKENVMLQSQVYRGVLSVCYSKLLWLAGISPIQIRTRLYTAQKAKRVYVLHLGDE